MANNLYVNKVVFGNTTLIDTSNVTVTSDKLVNGYTALDASGALVSGNMVVQHYYTGSSEPDASLGVDGDIYLEMGGS